MGKLYVNSRDYQSGNAGYKYGGFAFGFVGTIKDWKNRALEWCDSDGNLEMYNYIKKHKLNEDLLEDINKYWDIKIVELNKDNIRELVEYYHAYDFGVLVRYLIDYIK